MKTKQGFRCIWIRAKVFFAFQYFKDYNPKKYHSVGSLSIIHPKYCIFLTIPPIVSASGDESVRIGRRHFSHVLRGARAAQYARRTAQPLHGSRPGCT